MNKADNLPMSAEDFLRDTCPNHTDQSKWNKSELLYILHNHANYLLSHHINVLAERIAEKAKVKKTYLFDLEHKLLVDKESIIQEAKDYINELNLQSSK